jgi:hypothetical protein
LAVFARDLFAAVGLLGGVVANVRRDSRRARQKRLVYLDVLDWVVNEGPRVVEDLRRWTVAGGVGNGSRDAVRPEISPDFAGDVVDSGCSDRNSTVSSEADQRSERCRCGKDEVCDSLSSFLLFLFFLFPLIPFDFICYVVFFFLFQKPSLFEGHQNFFSLDHFMSHKNSSQKSCKKKT